MANDEMRNGYKQNTKGFGLYLRYSKPLDRVMRYHAVQVMWYFRKNARRSNQPGPHNADMVRVEKKKGPGGRNRDRMEYRVVAYGPNAAMEEFGGKSKKTRKQGQHTLRKALIYVSEGRTITRGGKVV